MSLFDNTDDNIASTIAGTGSIAPISASLIAGKDNFGNLKPILTNTSGSVYVNIINNSITTTEIEEPTFVLTANNITIGNNKSMLALLNNNNTNIIKIKEIYIKNISTSALTGLVATFELFRFTGMSLVGNLISSLPYDTTDILPTNITGSNNGTITGELSTSFFRYLFSTDEWSQGTLDVEAHQNSFQTYFPVWKRHDTKSKSLTLRTNQGIHIKCTTNSSVGAFDLSIIYTIS